MRRSRGVRRSRSSPRWAGPARAGVWVGASFLRERLGDDVGAALPLWDFDEAGLHQVDATKARSAGLRCRPFGDTARDILEGNRERVGAPLKVGLTPEREAELLAAWAAGRPR